MDYAYDAVVLSPYYAVFVAGHITGLDRRFVCWFFCWFRTASKSGTKKRRRTKISVNISKPEAAANFYFKKSKTFNICRK